MSNTLQIDGHTEEVKKLRMSPFTLAEEAEEWFYSLPIGSITSWEEMEKAFLNEYFPASVFLRRRYEILNFKQKDEETLGDAYKRFKRLIDTAAGGSTNFSTTTDIKKIIEAIAANEHLELYDRCQSNPEGVIDLKLETNKIRIEDTIAVKVEKKLKAVNIGTQQVAQVQSAPTVYCEICNGPHQMNHPNFSWKGRKGNTPQDGQYQTQYQQQQQQQAPKKADWEIDIERMEAHNIQFEEETRNNQKNTTTSIKNLEVQMGKIAQQLASSSQVQGALPSATVKNPREHNNVSVVTTRSGKSNEVVEEMNEEEDQLIEVDLEIKENEALREEVVAPKPVVKETVTEPKPGMKIPMKKKDRGEVTIPCTIEDRSFKKALIDLGASMSLMSLSIYKKLGIGLVQDTRMTLQFADHLVKKPYGIVEDVLVKIDKFVFRIDFVILEMPEDEEIPPILRRPFLETGRCLINIEEGTMTLKVYDEELKIDVRNTMKYKDDICTSHTIEVLDQVMTYDSPLNVSQLHLERVLSLSIFENDKEVDKGESEVLALMDAQPPWKGSRPHRREDLRLPQTSEEDKDPKKGTKLKKLPENLKYVFLDSEGIKPTVCMDKIIMEEDHKLVVQPQRRFNPPMKEVVRKEVVELLEAGLIYPISDSPWVSPVYVVPKKWGTTVIRNEKNDLIPTRTTIG
ncbi:uncharacterized protein LOC127094391 [Lathyrus oleraceus]|uniref:uncharacterized protein LOC127094391 n=1 Tax=Pisum sativum TaxID=3888 RepID=UPI0021D0784D|nr:uncharacterized protein LOC127094391 [Pisum sativum]